jgi:RND family efflux transporter MFP subunit
MKNRSFFIFILFGCSFISSSWAADIDASLYWANRTELSTLVSGVVEKVNVDVGDHVKKGQVLLNLNPSSFTTKVDKASANLESARVNLEEAKREMDRSRELFDRTVLSVHELQLVENQLIKANAQFEAARTNLNLARISYNLSIQKAPYDGLVIKRYAQPGQVVVTTHQAIPLLVVVDATRMLVRAAVEQQQMEKLSRGDKVTVNAGGNEYTAVISSIGLESVKTSGDGIRFIVEAGFPVDIKDNLRAGMKVKLVLP